MLSDDDLGLILEGKGMKLQKGEKSREEAINELAQLLAEDLRERDEAFVTRGRLQSQGRASFGRANEGREGLALFIPDDE